MRTKQGSRILMECEVCGTEFLVWPSDKVKADKRGHKIRYCSNKCKGIDYTNKSFIKRMGKEKATEAIKLIKESKIEARNPQWKGDKVGLNSLHQWIGNRKPKPELCEMCGIKPPIDLANISQEYKRDVNDYEWLCRKCHMTKDGRLKRLLEFFEQEVNVNDKDQKRLRDF